MPAFGLAAASTRFVEGMLVDQLYLSRGSSHVSRRGHGDVLPLQQNEQAVPPDPHAFRPVRMFRSDTHDGPVLYLYCGVQVLKV